MDLSKVMELLGVQSLDESKQTDIQSTLTTIIESKATAIAQEKIEEGLNAEKATLVEEFEGKFNDYKEDITSKFSNFVDSILEEEMIIPEKVVKYARLGEMYEDLVEQFKVRLAIDEGVLDGEVQGMLKEAKDEIVALQTKVTDLENGKVELEADCNEMATHIYLSKKCEGLTESQRKTVMAILEGASKEDVDAKFGVIVESLDIVIEKEDKKGDDEEEEDDKKDKMDEADDKKKEGDDEEEEDDKKDKMDESSKGHSEVEGDGKDGLNEDANSPFSQAKSAWLTMLRENKI